MARIRTFVAVETTDEVRRNVETFLTRLGRMKGDWKWVSPENLHWTLQFLGDVEELEIPDVCAAVATAAADSEPFELEAAGAGAFPSNDRPRIVWIGAGAGAAELVALQRGIQRRLKQLGYRGENRRFVPHLTVGRAGRRARPISLARELAAVADYCAGAHLVEEVTIFSSELTREGSRYEVLARAPLAP